MTTALLLASALNAGAIFFLYKAVTTLVDQLRDLRAELHALPAGPAPLADPGPPPLSAEKPYISDYPHDDERWNAHVGALEDEA